MQNQNTSGSLSNLYQKAKQDLYGNVPESISAPLERKMKKSMPRVVLTHQMLRAIKNSPKGTIPRGLTRKVARRKKLNQKNIC